MEVYEEEDPNETPEDIAEQQEEVIYRRVGESYSFYIKARDVAKYGAHPGCPECRFVLGEVAPQCGHNKECKSSKMTSMEADKDDKNRVRRWHLAKGIDEESKQEEEKINEQAGAKKEDTKAEMQVSIEENKRKQESEDERAAKKRELVQDANKSEGSARQNEVMRKFMRGEKAEQTARPLHPQR